MSPTETFSRRGFLKIGGAGLATAYLAGCTVGGGGGASDEKAAAQALDAAFVQPINDLDPHGPSSVDEATLLAGRLIYDTLIKRDKENLVPGIAKSWEQPDPNTWVFTLRDHVTFHDGRPLTANDVKYSLERVKNANTAQSALWVSVDTIEASDNHTLRITTKQPLGTMLVNLTLMFVLPEDSADSPEFFRNPIGSGPFKVDSFTPAAELTLSPAPSYWGTKATLDTVRLPFIPETSSQVTALRTGDLDVLWPVPPDQLRELEGIDKVSLQTVPSYVYYFNWFNCGRKPFDDARVRRAMWHGANVAGIVQSLFGKGAKVMTAPIPETVFGHAAQQPHPYDPDLAKRELAEAGYPDGFRTTLMWFDATGPLARQLAQALISEWEKIGVTVEPQSVAKAEWLRRLNSLDWDMDLQTNTVTTGDADFTLGRLYNSDANRMGYSNKELDGILQQAHEISEQAKRKSLYEQACEIIWTDAVGLFPAALISTYGVRDHVEGFVPAPSNQPDLTGVSIKV